MPRADEPRVTIRFSAEEWADVERAASAAGVATGALVRWCAVMGCAYWAAEMAAARVRGETLPVGRRRNGVR